MWPVRDKCPLAGLIAKGFTMVDGLCAIQILQRPFARRGLICQGGLYIVDTVFLALGSGDLAGFVSKRIQQHDHGLRATASSTSRWQIAPLSIMNVS
jgi:hypothetical protein